MQVSFSSWKNQVAKSTVLSKLIIRILIKNAITNILDTKYYNTYVATAHQIFTKHHTIRNLIKHGIKASKHSSTYL